MNRWSGEKAFAVALLAASTWLVVETLGLGSGARRVPLVVIWPVLALLVVHLVRGDRPTVLPEVGNARRRHAIPWVLLLPVLIFALGMYLGPGLYTLIFARARGKDTWGASIVLSAGVTAGAWLLVGVLLGGAGPDGAAWSLFAP